MAERSRDSLRSELSGEDLHRRGSTRLSRSSIKRYSRQSITSHHGAHHKGKRQSISAHEHPQSPDGSPKKQSQAGPEFFNKHKFVKMLIGSMNGKREATAMSSLHAVTVKRLISRSKDMQVEVYEKLTNYEAEACNKTKNPAIKERLRQKATQRMRNTRQMLIKTRLNSGSSFSSPRPSAQASADPFGASTPAIRKDQGMMPAGMILLRAVSEEVEAPHKKEQGQRNESLMVAKKELPMPANLHMPPAMESRRSSRRMSVVMNHPLDKDQLEKLARDAQPGAHKWFRVLEIPRLRTRFRAEHDQQILSDRFSEQFKTRRRIFQIWASELGLRSEDLLDISNVYNIERADLEVKALQKHVVERQAAARMIQAKWLHRNFQRDYRSRKQEELAALIKVQRFWHRKCQFQLPVQRRLQEHSRRMRILLKLQAVTRGWLARKKLQTVRELRDVDHHMTDLQWRLGSPLQTLVKLQARIRGFITRKRLREQAAREALHRVMTPSEEERQCLDDTIALNDLCRSRPNRASISMAGSSDRSKVYGSRRRSMAVGNRESPTHFKGAKSARGSLIGGGISPLNISDLDQEGMDATASLPSTRASTRISNRSSFSPGSMRAKLSPMTSCRATLTSSCRGSIVRPNATGSILEHGRALTVSSSSPTRRSVLLHGGASPDSCSDTPQPQPRTHSPPDLVPMPPTPRPHTSCGTVRPRPASQGSVVSRNIIVPIVPVRAAATFRRAGQRAQTPRV